MRHGAAALLVAAVAASLAGCASAPAGTVSAQLEDLPTALATADPSEVIEKDAGPMPTLSVAPESAEPLSSIHRGPVQAVISAVRQSDGEEFGVRVHATRAIDADPFLTADCGDVHDEGTLAIVVQDLAVDTGIATATLGVPEALDGPGIYEGVVTFLDVKGEAIRGTGQIVVDSGLDSGTFDVSDPGTGDHLIGAWECRSL